MGLKLEDQIADYLEDDAGLCLRELHANRTWTTMKRHLFEKLMDIAKREHYLRFTGDYRDYHLERKGQSCLYDVPLDQRGALKKFRGMRVRLICAGGWDPYSGRFFLAKPVRVKPDNPI